MSGTPTIRAGPLRGKKIIGNLPMNFDAGSSCPHGADPLPTMEKLEIVDTFVEPGSLAVAAILPFNTILYS